jgi:hypothetical protein
MSHPTSGHDAGPSHPHPSVVVPDASTDRIDDRRPRVTGERAVPYHCPYCAEEDLRPLEATPGAWHCRACTRTFSVTYRGMQPLEALGPPPPPTLADPHPTGALR